MVEMCFNMSHKVEEERMTPRIKESFIMTPAVTLVSLYLHVWPDTSHSVFFFALLDVRGPANVPATSTPCKTSRQPQGFLGTSCRSGFGRQGMIQQGCWWHAHAPSEGDNREEDHNRQSKCHFYVVRSKRSKRSERCNTCPFEREGKPQ